MNTPESKSAAYAEEKAEQWLLSPEGGWKYKPDEKDFILRTEPFVQEVLPVFNAEKAAYLAGYTADRWIPVSQPPDESGRYWCYVSDVNDLGVSHYQWNCAYTKHNNSWTIDRLEQYGGTVTHWQPLPSPPTK